MTSDNLENLVRTRQLKKEPPRNDELAGQVRNILWSRGIKWLKEHAVKRPQFESCISALLVGFLGFTSARAAGASISLLPDTQVKGAFTQIPEVLKAYARGLSFCEAGLPEYSVELFRSAFEADTTFLLAKVAEMEAYRALSLEEHAELVKEQLLQEAGAREFLSWETSRPSGSGTRSPDIEKQIEAPAPLLDPSELERPCPYSAELFAQALRHYSQDTTDRVRIVRLYARYAVRQWEHRMVLMRHLLTLTRGGQPDDVNWMSTALWRIRQEKYRKGAGYSIHLDPVQTDLGELLVSYPSSLAASCVRYSIALERASEGSHQEALSLFEDVILVFSQTREIDIPCDYWANLYFFAAREAKLAGLRHVALDYLEHARNPADQSCHQRNFCLSWSQQERIPVMAAMGVDYQFSRLCGKGPGWALDNFTLGLDRNGRIFESGQAWWGSISSDVRSLTAELSETADAVPVTRRLEAIVALLDTRYDESPTTATLKPPRLSKSSCWRRCSRHLTRRSGKEPSAKSIGGHCSSISGMP